MVVLVELLRFAVSGQNSGGKLVSVIWVHKIYQFFL